MTERRRITLLGHIRPIHLLTTTGLYILGTGIARYLGERIDLSSFSLGLIWIITIQLGFYFLGDNINSPFDIGLYNRLPPESPRSQNQSKDREDLLLFTSLALLSAAGVLTVILGIQRSLSLPSGLIMGVFFFGFCLLVIPGISLENSGIGEIITSIILVLCPPAIGFLLQYDVFHPFLVFGIFPIFPLHLALIIVLRLLSFRDDLRLVKKNLLVRLGWIQAIFIHNVLIFCGFLLFGFGLFFGFPFQLVGFVFFALPPGLYLVWYLSKLEDGVPVRWYLIISLSVVVFFLPLYLLTYSTWMN